MGAHDCTLGRQMPINLEAIYIVPRVSGMTNSMPGMVVFMERMGSREAEAAMAGGSRPDAVSPKKIDPARWVWMPREIDPGRPFQFNVTGIETRTDTGFVAGEDMVVFGTGFPNGVKYMLAGETKPREIPGGETFSSKVFCVCGRKIVLTKRNQVFVFDTRTQKMNEISEDQISLYNPSANQFSSNGYLVATVNRAVNVKDRTIVKVIDVSGEEPSVIPIKNADYTDADITSVAVDSKNGAVAISSRSKKRIAAAKVKPLADQYLYDVSEYRGVASFPIVIEGDDVTYIDEDWKVRRLDLTNKSPIAITQTPLARSGQGFWVRKGRLVVFSKEGKVGSRMPVAVSDSADAPQMVAGTGTEIAATSGKLGFGGSAAIALDKTVFLAGTAGDSIGTGERLQFLTEDGWKPILGSDGKPVWGSEVVTSMGFMALKVRNEAGKTVIGYATYGERISPSDVAKAVASPAVMHTKPSSPAPATPVKQPTRISEIDEAFIEAMLESESDIVTAYKVAFGEEGAKQRLLEGWKTTLENSDKMYLMDELKKRSESFKP